MLTKTPVLGNAARDFLRENIEPSFVFEQGQDLDAVVSEVLHDKDLFMFLAVHSPPGRGLKLGCISYFNDIHVDVVYGLVLDFDHRPRKVQLFTYEYFGCLVQEDLHLGPGFPRHLYHRFEESPVFCFSGYPTPEKFVEQVNRVLQCPPSNVVDLNALVDLKTGKGFSDVQPEVERTT